MSFDAKRAGLVAAAVLLAGLASTLAAHAASPENRAAARQHLNQAEALKKKGQLEEACQHLQEAARLDAQLPTLMELAECTEQIGNVIQAENFWSQARDQAKHDEKPQSRARAEARLAAVQKRIAHLTLRLAANTPAGVQVLRDDVAVDPASLGSALPTNPGDHVIWVKLAGHDDAKYPLKLADGDNQTLAIAPGPAQAAQAAPAAAPVAAPAPAAASPVAAPPAQPAVTPSTSWWSGQRTAGAIMGSVGVLAIGGGTALYVLGNRNASKHGTIADQRVALGGISLVSGSVLFLSGVVLFASAPSAEAAQHAGRSIAPTLLLARGTGVLGAVGEF